MRPFVRYHVAPTVEDSSTYRTAVLSRNLGLGVLDLAVILHATDLHHPAFGIEASGRTAVLRVEVEQGTSPGQWSEWP